MDEVRNPRKTVPIAFQTRSKTNFATDDEMLDCIRKFYDWDSRKDTYPHRPPELDVWKFIQRQLHPKV